MVLLTSIVPTVVASHLTAATWAPPMLDISKNCEAANAHNVNAMSECVVAESMARSDLLRNWDKLADAGVETCLKLNRKVKHRPYEALAKCLAVPAGDAAPVHASQGNEGPR